MDTSKRHMAENLPAANEDERQQRRQGTEDEKQQIRERIRESKAAPEAEFFPADPEPKINDDQPKRVAAYARVSTLSTDQVSSIENQTKFYTEKITNTPNWTFQGVYSDEGKSGTSMKRRTEFKRLLQDAAAGNIDLILCASVSRWARNLSDCVDQARALATNDPKHPVGIFFETENIYTLDPNSNKAFEMHALLADWESETKSRRMLLSYDQRIVMGQYPVADLLGYRHTKDGQLIIQEDEAITIRYIFIARAVGNSYAEIAEVLTEKERPTLTGRTEWNGSMVANIMKNERRWGDLEARKTTTTDYKLGKTVRNTYEKDGVIHHIRNGAIVRNHHEGIVSPDMARAAGMAVTDGGIADLYVIPEGTLKGFVSTAIGWSGIDAEILMESCSSVYTELELSEIEKASRIRTGEAHSNIVSMQFHGYKIPRGSLFISNDTAQMTISKDRIAFNKKLLDRFGSYSHVEILYHPILQMVALRSSNNDSENAFSLQDENGKAKKSFRAPGICKALFEQMDWIQSYSFRFRGIYRERNGFQIMLFYLDEPLIIPDKKTKEKYRSTDGHAAFHYIPYRNSDIQSGETVNGKAPSIHDTQATPSVREKRDWILQNIQGDDIRRQGIVTKVSKLGNIPTRAEALAELEELLLSM